METLKPLRPILDLVELNLALLQTSVAYENQNNLMTAYNNHFYELYKSFINEQKKIRITYKQFYRKGMLKKLQIRKYAIIKNRSLKSLHHKDYNQQP